MTIGAPLKFLYRHCLQQSTSPSLRSRERISPLRHERRPATGQDVRAVYSSTPTVPRINPKRRPGRLNAIQQPPLLGTSKGLTIHLDVEYIQLLGLHFGENINENKVLSAFGNLSAAKIEEGYSARAMAGRQQLLEEAKEIALKSIGKKIANDKKRGIDLPVHLIPGALSILTQVEEHELVMQVGKKMLESRDVANMKRDILLSMALAKLGQAEYYFSVPNQVAMACTCMDAALQLLTDGGSPQLAPTLCKEIEDALETYVPQCVLDQLKLPLNGDNTKGRKDAISILQGLLAVPRPADYSFIGVDRHYVKQVLDCLTCVEILQTIDWTTVLTDPKCVKWYYPGLLLKGASVHIVVGFIQRRPALLKNIDTILSIPGKDREAHVEHVICKLLLGEVDDAFKILDKIEGAGKLEASGGMDRHVDRDGATAMTLPVISSEHSAVGAKAGDEGCLQGLCLFCERWLQNAGYTQFRDTSMGRPTTALNDYFKDRKVQNMLNTTPGSRNGLFDLMTPNKKEENKTLNGTPVLNGFPPTAAQIQGSGDASVAERFVNSGVAYHSSRQTSPLGIRLRKPSALWLATLGGALLGGFIFATIRNPSMLGSKSMISPTASKTVTETGKKSKPTILEVKPSGETKRKRRPMLPLRKSDAEKLIHKWQFAKAEALGPDHEFKYMKRVLADPMLQTWTSKIKEASDRGLFWIYKLDHCKVTQVDSQHLHEDGHVDVVASLKESATMYGKDGKEIDKYKSRYNVEYHVVLDEDGRWKINYVKVLPQHT